MPVRDKYRRRIDEGYDLPGSPVYNAWKKLFLLQVDYDNLPPTINPSLSHDQLSSSTAPMPAVAPLSINIPSNQLLSSERVSPVLSGILVYPSACDNPEKSKSNKITLPNFMTSESSMQVLRDQKLKKARELAEKQKRLREKEEKREAKKKQDEEKKKEREERKKEREEKKKEREEKKTKRTRKETQGKRQRPDDEFDSCDENTCKVCLTHYEDGDVFRPWVMCNSCQKWMHIECIPIGIDVTAISDDSEEQFFCHDCA